MMKILTLVAIYFWILENDDVTCNPKMNSFTANIQQATFLRMETFAF